MTSEERAKKLISDLAVQIEMIQRPGIKAEIVASIASEIDHAVAVAMQRAAVEYEARGLERAAEGIDNLVADRSIVEGSDVYAVLTQVAGSIRAMKEQR